MNSAPNQALDRVLVVEAIDRLFICTDNRDWDRVKALLAEQVEFDMTSLAGGTPAVLSPQQIVDGWREGLKGVAAVHHQSGNHLVELRGDHATAFCYATATHYRPQAEKRVTTFVGSYEFALRRDASGWRITRFKFNKKYVE